MITSSTYLIQADLKLVGITATGMVNGEDVQFKAEKNPSGKYVVAHVRGKAPGSKPNHAINNVYLDTLEEAGELLSDNNEEGIGYYIWLHYRSPELMRRNQYSPMAITYHYKKVDLL